VEARHQGSRRAADTPGAEKVPESSRASGTATVNGKSPTLPRKAGRQRMFAGRESWSLIPTLARRAGRSLAEHRSPAPSRTTEGTSIAPELAKGDHPTATSSRPATSASGRC